jgi:hypothetical protein
LPGPVDATGPELEPGSVTLGVVRAGNESAPDGDGDNNCGSRIGLSGSGSALEAGALDEEFEGAVTPGSVTPDGADERAGSDVPLSGRGGVAADGTGTPANGNVGRPPVAGAAPLGGALALNDGMAGTPSVGASDVGNPAPIPASGKNMLLRGAIALELGRTTPLVGSVGTSSSGTPIADSGMNGSKEAPPTDVAPGADGLAVGTFGTVGVNVVRG